MPDEPNLELPSFGFRRKKRDRPVEADPEAVAEEPMPPQETTKQAPEQMPEPTEVITPAATEAVPPVASVPVGAALGAPVAVRQDSSALDVADEPARDPVDEPPVRARRERDPLRPPVVPGPLAAVVTGLVCGFITVLLAFASARGCQEVRGVGSCGGFGLVALVVVLTLTVLIGGLLLRGFRAGDPTSTSFLGNGLMAVVVMLFLLGSIDSRWMLAVIPVLTAATFLLAWWVTTKFTDVGDQLRRD